MAQSWITSKQFAESRAFYNLEPWGGQADDLRTALILMALGAGQGKGRKRVALRDLMPSRFLAAIEEKVPDVMAIPGTKREKAVAPKPRRPQQSAAEMKRVMRGWGKR